MRRAFVTATTASLVAAVGAATAQSDPSLFGTVYNIGRVPPGSIFDVPGAVAGTRVGDGDFNFHDGFITPSFLVGDTLGSDSQLNLFDGGEILAGFSAGPGDGTGSNIQVNISGGTVGDRFEAYNSTVNISGGTVGFRSGASNGGTVNISGGSILNGFEVGNGSTVNISGGNIGIFFYANFGSTVSISGGAFELNGMAVSDLAGGLGEVGTTDLFTGILQDGSAFILGGGPSDWLPPGTTTLRSVAVTASTNPGVLSSGTFTKGVRAGETLTVTGDGVLGDSFAVVDGTLNIVSGSAGIGLEVAFGTVNISGGSVGTGLTAHSGGVINVSGGLIDEFFTAASGGTANISGGTVGDTLIASSGSTVNISGGSVGDHAYAASGSTVNLFGLSFFLDGVEFSGLALDEPFIIIDRDVTLSGLLADGSAFEFDLNSTFTSDRDSFQTGSTLTVTLVPAPGAAGVIAIGGILAARRRR